MANNNSDSIVVEDNAQFDTDPKSPGFQTDAEKSISDDSKNISHSMNHDETSSLINEKQKCPRCGKLTLQVSFPDTYEIDDYLFICYEDNEPLWKRSEYEGKNRWLIKNYSRAES